MNRSHRHLLWRPWRAAGFSIVELLIAVMIIAILALILVPTVNKRAAEARLAACKREMEAIAMAEERVAADIGYYVRLFALTDVAQGDGVGLRRDGSDVYDGIGDEYVNELFDNSERIFIRPTDHVLLDTNQAETVFETVLKLEKAYNAGETSYSPVWSGPYYTIHSDQTPAQHDDSSDALKCHDIPNDPWGRDYILVIPGDVRLGHNGGFVVEPDGAVFEDHSFGGVTINATRFDRPAIVSLGPDGMPGAAGVGLLGDGDDLVRHFGY